MPPDDDGNPLINGAVIFVSFLIFGLIPLLCKSLSIEPIGVWSAARVAYSWG